jgi:hypothetical protein
MQQAGYDNVSRETFVYPNTMQVKLTFSHAWRRVITAFRYAASGKR